MNSYQYVQHVITFVILKNRKRHTEFIIQILHSKVSFKTLGSSISSSHLPERPVVGLDECEAGVVVVAELLLKKLKIHVDFCFVCFFFSL